MGVHYDGKGNLTAGFDGLQAGVMEYDSDPFGKLLVQIDSSTQPFLSENA